MNLILTFAVLGMLLLCFWTVGMGYRLSLGRSGVFLFLTSLSTALFYGAYRLSGEPLELGVLAKMMGEANYAFLILFLRSQRKVLSRTAEIRGMLVVALVSLTHLTLNLTLTGFWQMSVMTVQVLVLIGWLALEAWWLWRAQPDGIRFFLLVLVVIHWMSEFVGRSLLWLQDAMGLSNMAKPGWTDVQNDWMWVTFFLGFMTQMAAAGVVAQALREGKDRMELLVNELEIQLKEKSSMMMRLVASNAAREPHHQLASLAHELRQPLGAIQINAQFLANSKRLNPEEESQVLKEILHQNERATSIVQGLRNLFIDKTPPQSRLQVPEWLCQWVVQQVPIWQTHGVHLRLDEKEQPFAEVLANQVQLEMVLQNLVKNAAEELAPRGGGVIVLSLSMTDRWVYIDAVDNGPGIPPALQEKVFEMNYSTKADGMGMGLWLSRRIAQTHGGHLACVSCSQGACMRLTLPRV